MNRWISKNLFEQFTQEQTTAHRIYTSPSAWAERLGADVLLSYKVEKDKDVIFQELRQWESEVGFASARVFARYLPRQNAERVAPVLLAGNAAASLEGMVTEWGVRFCMDFGAGYSAGFFIDQRNNRAYLQKNPPKRLLNTFAYTCSFSVVAALAGAQTVSIDLSKKSLDRGRKNFAENGLELEGHRFLADDVMEVLGRMERKGEKFDGIILDPPTFSLGHKGRRWQVEEQIEDLLRAALALAAPKASILISTNCTKLHRHALEQAARFALKASRRGGSFSYEPSLPDFPRGEGAQTLWLHVR